MISDVRNQANVLIMNKFVTTMLIALMAVMKLDANNTILNMIELVQMPTNFHVMKTNVYPTLKLVMDSMTVLTD